MINAIVGGGIALVFVFVVTAYFGITEVLDHRAAKKAHQSVLASRIETQRRTKSHTWAPV